MPPILNGRWRQCKVQIGAIRHSSRRPAVRAIAIAAVGRIVSTATTGNSGSSDLPCRPGSRSTAWRFACHGRAMAARPGSRWRVEMRVEGVKRKRKRQPLSLPRRTGLNCLDSLDRYCNADYTMTRRRTKQPMTEALRRAIVESELPFLTLEERTGVKRQSLMKFVRGETSLRLDVADKLADYFGFKISK
jgi:transcriptional regulator with XRE-family HTH domain